MKKFLYLLFFALIFAISARAQVTIGSSDAPQPGAVLELKSDTLGLLLPRIALQKLSLPNPLPANVPGMVIYNTTNSPADTLQAGIYYNLGTRWMLIASNPSFMKNWFYMPSIVFDVSTTTTGATKDLYQQFVNQFNTPVKVSTGAPAPVSPTLPGRTDLYYYVTAYDNSVFNNISIDANGNMTYDVVGAATDSTYINIVFVEK
jgi:hypothetical protein